MKIYIDTDVTIPGTSAPQLASAFEHAICGIFGHYRLFTNRGEGTAALMPVELGGSSGPDVLVYTDASKDTYNVCVAINSLPRVEGKWEGRMLLEKLDEAREILGKMTGNFRYEELPIKLDDPLVRRDDPERARRIAEDLDVELKLVNI
jgi:hypothetical protein